MRNYFKGCILRTAYGLMLSPGAACIVALTCAVLLLFLKKAISPMSAMAVILVLLMGEMQRQKFVRHHTIPISDFFAVIQRKSGVYTINAYRGDGEPEPCSEIMRGLIREQYTLIDAIPPGRYKAITHDTVMRRIEAADELFIKQCRPVGMGDLKSIQARMRAGKGCSCCLQKKNCRYESMISARRQFYYVEFEKIEKRE